MVTGRRFCPLQRHIDLNLLPLLYSPPWPCTDSGKSSSTYPGTRASHTARNPTIFSTGLLHHYSSVGLVRRTGKCMVWFCKCDWLADCCCGYSTFARNLQWVSRNQFRSFVVRAFLITHSLQDSRPAFLASSLSPMDHRSDSSCSSSSSSQTQTALPSIRQLDLHLPPPWAPPPAYSSSSSTQPPTQQQQHQQQHLPTLRESRSSEPEGEDSHSHTEEGPPKKRRRRQALSCTECKRRKIKCDRSQPCTPCARRGETDKCQWHASEPPNP